jgi:ElaB/YqjD/DUF883 family membrane-anchored ribosome-binding protein
MADKIEKAKDAVVEAVADSVERAREAVGDRLDTAKERLEDVGDDLGRKARRVSDEVRREAEKGARQARQAYEHAVDGLKRGYGKVRKDLGGLTDDVNAYVKDNPGKAILIAAGVGFVIGLLLRSGDRDRA